MAHFSQAFVNQMIAAADAAVSAAAATANNYHGTRLEGSPQKMSWSNLSSPSSFVVFEGNSYLKDWRTLQ